MGRFRPRYAAAALLVAVLVLPACAVGAEPAGRSGEGGRRKRTTAKATPSEDAAGDSAEAPGEMQEHGQDVFESYMRLAEAFATTDEEPMEVFYYPCENISSGSMKRILNDFVTARGTVSESDESGMVVVRDTVSNVAQIKEIARTVDRRVPQVLVQAQIVELTVDRDFEKELSHVFENYPAGDAFVRTLGANLPTPGASPSTGQGLNLDLQPWVSNYGDNRQNRINSILRYLETRGKARILSAPNLVLRRGTDGNIITGEEVPITQQTVTSGSITSSTVFKSVGIKLRVKPMMIGESIVRLMVSPEVSTITGYTQPDSTGVTNPIIAVRSASTTLEVKDGEVVSIGGLLRSEKREVNRRVPVLASLPGLGHFFRSSRVESIKTQLVIFLNITILDLEDGAGGLIVRPAELPERVERELEIMEDDARQLPRSPRDRLRRDVRIWLEDGRDPEED